MDINWVGAVLALVVGMVVAGIWYGKAFTTIWWKLTGITPEQSKPALLVGLVAWLGFSASTLLQHNASN